MSGDNASRDRLKLELKRASGPFLLYVLLCVGGLLTAADIIRNLAGDKPWISYQTYRVGFTDVKNVIPGQVELRLAGVKVGSVAGSQLVNGRPVLTLHLEDRYGPLYRDAQLRIRPVTPLEDMYVNILSRGHATTGVLKSSETLTTAPSASPVEISSVLDVLSADTRTRFATMLNELGRGLRGGGAQLRAAFEQLSPFLVVASQMSSALAHRRVELGRLVHNFGGITQELALRDRQLSGFVTNANTTLGAIATNNGPFAAMISELPSTLASLNTNFARLRTAETSLDPALSSLGPVATALPAGLDALQRFSVEATPALNALRPALRDLKPLAQTLKPTSAALQGAFTQLKPLAGQFDRTTTDAAVPSCLTYIGQFLNRVISMTKFGDGVNTVANARAHVNVDFESAGAATKDPAWQIQTPCFHQTGASAP
jgi:ABC-type transporter Mla subunit MlaD